MVATQHSLLLKALTGDLHYIIVGLTNFKREAYIKFVFEMISGTLQLRNPNTHRIGN
jgi:hypothetical protein